jgi:hypothetical protein
LKSLLFYTIILFSFLSFSAIAFERVNTSIINKEDDSWLVTYETEIPVKQLAFKSSPNNSRSTRWIAEDNEYAIFYQDSIEYIRRKDGGNFTNVTFILSPTYTSLPKEYAPFSPFTDGGLLFHSGRFFVCSEICESKTTVWELNLRSPVTKNIIINGVVRNKEFSWQSFNEGEKVYVGPGTPLQNEHFIAVIDDGLPEKVKKHLNQYLPLLMEQYSEYFGIQKKEKPMVFASYSRTEDGTYGNQGGVLPNQIFMHWYGKESNIRIDENNILWFFSHEVAHLYQGDAAEITDAENAWINEGSAEFMASVSLKELLPQSSDFIAHKINKAKLNCLKELKGYSLVNSAKRKKFELYYTCGLIINQAIHNEANKINIKVNTFTIWESFQKRVNAGEPASSKTFLASVKPFVSKIFFDDLQELILPENKESTRYVEKLQLTSYSNGR